MRLKEIDEQIAAEPRNIDAWISRGELFGKVGMKWLALDNFEKAIRLDPTEPSSYFFRARYYAEISYYQKAINALTTAVVETSLVRSINRNSSLRAR
jgi:tetratricopeptide (TPR) repeat protein